MYIGDGGITLRKFLAGLAAAGVSAGGIVAGAVAPAQAAPAPCGFYKVVIDDFITDARYNHCGDGSVLVTIDGYVFRDQYTVCLSPGVHHLSDYYKDPIRYANSQGAPC